MRAIYAFSGDPITHGHVDIVRRAAQTYSEVVVAIGENPAKSGKYLFTSAERLVMAQRVLAPLKNVSCVTFTGLLGEYAYRHGFDVIVRGVRNVSDLESELVFFAVNQSLHPKVDTVFFPTHRHLSHISSGVVKAIVAEGGDVSQYCPLSVKEELERRILGRCMIAVAGGIAAGKTYVARQLAERIGRQVPATYISLDRVGHYVLGDSQRAVYVDTRRQIAARFGKDVLNADGSVDRRALGRQVFADSAALADLDTIMREPMLARLYEETSQLADGVVVLEGAIIVEANWTNLVNNNVVLVDASEDLRATRLMERDRISRDEAIAKIRRQVSAEERLGLLNRAIAEQRWGRPWSCTEHSVDADLERIAAEICRIAVNPTINDK